MGRCVINALAREASRCHCAFFITSQTATETVGKLSCQHHSISSPTTSAVAAPNSVLTIICLPSRLKTPTNGSLRPSGRTSYPDSPRPFCFSTTTKGRGVGLKTGSDAAAQPACECPIRAPADSPVGFQVPMRFGTSAATAVPPNVTQTSIPTAKDFMTRSAWLPPWRTSSARIAPVSGTIPRSEHAVLRARRPGTSWGPQHLRVAGINSCSDGSLKCATGGGPDPASPRPRSPQHPSKRRYREATVVLFEYHSRRHLHFVHGSMQCTKICNAEMTRFQNNRPPAAPVPTGWPSFEPGLHRAAGRSRDLHRTLWFGGEID